MKEIILLDLKFTNDVKGERLCYNIGEYCFEYIDVFGCSKTEIEKYIKSLEEYAYAVYDVLENSNTTTLENIGYIPYGVYSKTLVTSPHVYNNQVQIKMFKLSDTKGFISLYNDIKNSNNQVSVCKELLYKLGEIYRIADIFNSTNNCQPEELVDVIDVEATLVDTEKQAEDSEKCKERIKQKLDQIENYNKEEEARKACSATTPIILPNNHPEGCTCGCKKNPILYEGIIEGEQNTMINGIDYNVLPEFVDINTIKNVLSAHTANYQNKYTYWRAVPRCFMRDSHENNVKTDAIRDAIQSGAYPRTSVNGAQDFYIQNFPADHILDVVSIDKNGELIPGLSMIIDYMGVFSFLPDQTGTRSLPAPTIYIGCSVIQHADFCRYIHRMEMDEPLKIQPVPFTLKNLSTLMNIIDAKRCPNG